jgi:hypothetical protein
VYGPHAPFTVLTDAPTAAPFEFPDEPTLFGSLARLVWDPLAVAGDR